MAGPASESFVGGREFHWSTCVAGRGDVEQARTIAYQGWPACDVEQMCDFWFEDAFGRLSFP